MPNIDDINTEIPIPQYLPQKQPILSANAIENLHHEFIKLLKKTGQDDSQIKESLKRHLLAELNFLMESGNWKDADINTYDFIILAGSTEAGFEIENISCRDVSSIDRLWVEHSDGTFGFSVQKTILDEFASLDYSEVNWDGFYEKIGWITVEEVVELNYEKGIFNPESAKRGHLPIIFNPRVAKRGHLAKAGEGWERVEGVLRLVDCNIQALQPSVKIP
ncbi:MAG: GUN4 domain-containing protein [Coleofasciculus sp. D1-CHI-01]|uniref:GUN4 domain-containing protein n=1 Tax=Coleofasciculus sp. D1-CHI-01 TaxID=3068482 RepID=UPI0033036F32